MLIGLALIWGASFLFIKVAVRELTPATLILERLGLAAVTLALLIPFAVGTWGAWGQVPEHWGRLVPPGIAVAVALRAGVAEGASEMPGGKTMGGVVALGTPGTAPASLLFSALISGPGAAYASLVTSLIPPIALAYGAVFLGERFGAAALGGLALILAGGALGTRAGRGARFRRARRTGGPPPRSRLDP